MTFQIFHASTPSYTVSEVSSDDILEVMGEALRLETKSGVEGWMIRDLRNSKVREYPAFLSPRVGLAS